MTAGYDAKVCYCELRVINALFSVIIAFRAISRQNALVPVVAFQRNVVANRCKKLISLLFPSKLPRAKVVEPAGQVAIIDPGLKIPGNMIVLHGKSRGQHRHLGFEKLSSALSGGPINKSWTIVRTTACELFSPPARWFSTLAQSSSNSLECLTQAVITTLD